MKKSGTISGTNVTPPVPSADKLEMVKKVIQEYFTNYGQKERV